jgi:hypothetical protein
MQASASISKFQQALASFITCACAIATRSVPDSYAVDANMHYQCHVSMVSVTGLHNFTTVTELAHEWPTIYPFQGSKYYVKRNFGLSSSSSSKRSTTTVAAATSSANYEPVAAVMTLHDPLDWAVEAQVLVDVLRGGASPICNWSH